MFCGWWRPKCFVFVLGKNYFGSEQFRTSHHCAIAIKLQKQVNAWRCCSFLLYRNIFPGISHPAQQLREGRRRGEAICIKSRHSACSSVPNFGAKWPGRKEGRRWGSPLPNNGNNFLPLIKSIKSRLLQQWHDFTSGYSSRNNVEEKMAQMVPNFRSRINCPRPLSHQLQRAI